MPEAPGLRRSRRAAPAAEHPADPDGAALAALDVALGILDPPPHRPAPGERGVTLECGGWPLHVGIRLHRGYLRVQAEVAGPGALRPEWLLHRNRRDLVLVRYASSAAGATWVHGELPTRGLDAPAVDELLGRVLAAAEAARAVAAGPARA